jgi:simple sugar transport system ATP-binding protein
MNLSDRILVIYEGKIIAEFQAGKATESEIGFMMAGGGKERSKRADCTASSSSGSRYSGS